MNPNETNADKSIADNRLCLNHYLNKDMSEDNQTIVESTVSKSVKWPFVDRRLKRSTSVESVMMADSYQLANSGQPLTAHNYHHKTDQSTQTPEEWQELDKKRNEAKNKEHKIESVQNKAKSQEKKTDQRVVSNRDQSTQISECNSRQSKQVLIPSDISPIKSTTTKSGPIAIPTKLCVETNRSANSVEELNQEIESLVLRGICDYGDQQICDKIPEGHRAPVNELLCPQRAVKTQTVNRVGSSGEDSSDLSQPESPLFGTEPVSSTETNGLSDCSSPKINEFLTREPPDGCEKIRILNEDDRNSLLNGYPSVVRPVQPSSSFVLLPSRSSAFLPIFKPNDLSADYLQNRINCRKS